MLLTLLMYLSKGNFIGTIGKEVGRQLLLDSLNTHLIEFVEKAKVFIFFRIKIMIYPKIKYFHVNMFVFCFFLLTYVTYQTDWL